MAKLNDEISRILGGVTSKTILQAAAKGDFAHVMKLKNQFVKCSPKIANRLLTVKCMVSKRNLIHWLAYHKELEILEWVCGKDSYSVSSSSSNQRHHRPIMALKRKIPRKYFNVNTQDVYGFTALHLATWRGHGEIVKTLLAYDTLVEVDVVAENMKDLDGNEMKRNGQTALHIATAHGKFSIVKMLLDFLKDRMQDQVIEGREKFHKALSIKSTSGKTALHYAAEHGNWEVVKCLLEAMKLWGGIDIVNNCDLLRQTPLYLAVSNQNVEAVEILLREGEGLKVNIVTWEGITPLDKAKSNEVECQRQKQSQKFFAKKIETNHQRLNDLKKEEKTNQRIVHMLESYDVNWLHAERAKYANAANCLLVGAALIASITYASWLQPPLGLTQYYEFPVLNGAAPPESFESYVGVQQHHAIQLFWIFNSISFFCSIATFIIGADAGIPKRCASMREEVVELRQSTVRASFILSFAIVGVMGAFSVAGILVLPPIKKERAPTYIIVALGVIFCFILLMQFIKKIWIWFWSPSLQFKLEMDHTSERLPLDDALHKNGPLMPKSAKSRLPKSESANLGSPILVNENLRPSTLGSVGFVPPMPRSAHLQSSTRESMYSMASMSKSVDLGSSTPGNVDFVQSIPRSVDLGSPSLGNKDSVQPILRSVDFGPSTPRSVYSIPSMPKSADFGLPTPRSVHSMPSIPRSTNLESSIQGSIHCMAPMLKNVDLEPSISRSVDLGPLILENIDSMLSIPKSANLGTPTLGSLDFKPFMPRIANSMPTISRSTDLWPPTPRNVDSMPPMPRNTKLEPPTLESANSLPLMPRSANSLPTMPRSSNSLRPRSADFGLHVQKHPNKRLNKRKKEKKNDKICRLFEEQEERCSVRLPTRKVS